MGVGYRQSKRIWRRYQAEGDAGLVHRLRGQPSARRKPPELRAQVLARYAEERYADFGPTLMAESWRRKGWWWITRRCGAGCWPRASTPCGAGKQTAPAMAGAQAVLWGDGATGRLAPRLV